MDRNLVLPWPPRRVSSRHTQKEQHRPVDSFTTNPEHITLRYPSTTGTTATSRSDDDNTTILSTPSDYDVDNHDDGIMGQRGEEYSKSDNEINHHHHHRHYYNNTDGHNRSAPERKVSDYLSDNMPLSGELNGSTAKHSVAVYARVCWARRAGWLSAVFVVSYMLMGVLFYQLQTDWDLPNSLLFAMYTWTSIGYGHLPTPRTMTFQFGNMILILIGVAFLATVMAQVDQFSTLCWSRLRRSGILHKGYHRESSSTADTTTAVTAATTVGAGLSVTMNPSLPSPPTATSPPFRRYTRGITGLCPNNFKAPNFYRILHFVWHDDILRPFLPVVVPVAAMILIGPFLIGYVEGWSGLESLYFAVVSATTVGYGDYYPTTREGILLTTMWLPCNVIITSLYMGSIAKWYYRFSSQHIERNEKILHRHAVFRSTTSPTKGTIPSKVISLATAGSIPSPTTTATTTTLTTPIGLLEWSLDDYHASYSHHIVTTPTGGSQSSRPILSSAAMLSPPMTETGSRDPWDDVERGPTSLPLVRRRMQQPLGHGVGGSGGTSTSNNPHQAPSVILSS